MSLDGDLRDRMVALTGAPVQQDYGSAEKAQPRIWYERATGILPVSTTGELLVTETVYAVEVEGMDADAVAGLAAVLTDPASAGGLNGFYGEWGASRILGVFVEDAGDTFRFRGLGLDEGYHSAAFNLRVMT